MYLITISTDSSPPAFMPLTPEDATTKKVHGFFFSAWSLEPFSREPVLGLADLTSTLFWKLNCFSSLSTALELLPAWVVVKRTRT